MVVQVEITVFKPPDSISVLSCLRNFKTVCESDGIHKRMVCGFPLIFLKPTKAIFSHCMSDTAEKSATKKESRRLTVKSSTTCLRLTRPMMSLQKLKPTKLATSSSETHPPFATQKNSGKTNNILTSLG